MRSSDGAGGGGISHAELSVQGLLLSGVRTQVARA